MLIPEAEQRDLLIYAFRYVLGRQTYAPSTVIEVLRNAWHELSPDDRKLYKREIREAQERNMLGDPRIDAPGWLALLELPD